jgi:hypothetical protein
MSQDKKYQVFISSTYEDLIEERIYAMNAVMKLRQIPAGMELFSASNNTPWEEIEKEIDDSDYYILIIAYKYGSIDKQSKLSFTQKEYEYAAKQGKQILAFVIDDKKAKWEDSKRDKSAPVLKKLNAFKDIVKTEKLVEHWVDKEDLQKKILIALSLQIARNPDKKGWVRADETDYKNVAGELARLSKENEELREQVLSLKTENPYDLLTDQLQKINQKVTTRFSINGSKVHFIEKEVEINLFDLYRYLYIERTENLYHINQYKLILEVLKHFQPDDYKECIVDKKNEVARTSYITQFEHLSNFDLIDIITSNNIFYSTSNKGISYLKYIKRRELIEGKRI